MTVLYAVLILAGLGLILGMILAIASIALKVKEDNRIEEVEHMLPNYNCGACGYPGCHGMAEALVSGKEKKISKCKPGKLDQHYNPIIAYLKEHPGEDGTTHIPEV